MPLAYTSKKSAQYSNRIFFVEVKAVDTSGLLTMVYKSAVIALFLFLLTRIMGKKQIAQLTFFDYAVGISIGSVAGQVVIDKDTTILQGIVSMAVWSFFPIAFSFISIKNSKIRKILDGTPLILIQDGNIIEKNLYKSKFSVGDLLEELRQKDVFNLSEVEFAVFETSGKMSVMIKPQFKPVTLKDMHIPAAYKGLCANIIIDGKVIGNNLEIAGKNQHWLNEQLAKNNISMEKVLLASLDTQENLTFHLKDKAIRIYNVID